MFLAFAGLLFVFGQSAAAETYVLVYSEGSVLSQPGGNRVSRGDRIDAAALVQLGPADKAIFLSQSGNVVCHSGPFRGAVSGDEIERRSRLLDSLLALFGSQPAAPSPESCLK